MDLERLNEFIVIAEKKSIKKQNNKERRIALK